MPDPLNPGFQAPPQRFGASRLAWPGAPVPTEVARMTRDHDARAKYPLPKGFYTPEETAELEQIKQGQFFLMRNGRADDDPAVCPVCGRTEMYLTLGCIERPFNGLVEGLYAFVRVRPQGDERARIIGAMIQDLDQAHPYTANKLRPEEAGEDLLAWSLGVAEPIPREKAYALAKAINDRGLQPPLVLEPLILPRRPVQRPGAPEWR